MAIKNDGKYLEDAGEKIFKKHVTDPGFMYRRLPDAKTARGLFPAQPADFFLASGGVCLHVEFKSQKGKTHRLKKFDQLANMRRWAMAGIAGYVVVHFWETDDFALVDVDTLDPSQPSWVMTEIYDSFEAVMKPLEP